MSINFQPQAVFSAFNGLFVAETPLVWKVSVLFVQEFVSAAKQYHCGVIQCFNRFYAIISTLEGVVIVLGYCWTSAALTLG